MILMKWNIILLALICSIPLWSQRIERVEPPFWWNDMKWSTVQLLIYGENIADLDPQITSEEIALEKVIKTDNPNYLFLYINIAPGAKEGIVPISFFDASEALITAYEFDIKTRENLSASRSGIDNTDVIYLITPDRYANGNPDNDEFPDMSDKLNRVDKYGRHGGDIRGVIDNLEYIHYMGFTSVWLNPVLENDMPRFSYHGYAATDLYKVDKRFGSNNEYLELVEKARGKGVKVIMDMVMNHVGSEHWFVKDPPMDDWLNYQSDYQTTNHKRQTVQDIHASEYDKERFSDGWFVREMPDLNQRNPLMADYLIQNSIWWIEYTGIAGIRMDTYSYPDKDFMSDWTCAVMREYPNFYIVGEEWSLNPAIVSYWQKDKVNPDGYSSCLPGLMDFPLQNALREGISAEREKWNTGLIKMYEALANDFVYADPDKLVIFPDNHDMDRFFTQVNNDIDLFKMGLVFMATMRGIPQIYYGTEIAMDNDGYPEDHGVIRTDFPGGWEGDMVNAFTGEGLSNTEADIQEFSRRLFNWRKNATAVHHGNLIQFAPDNGIYSYIRTYEDEKILVLFSKTENPVDLDFSKYDELLIDNENGHEVLLDMDIDLSLPFTVQPKTAYIIEVK